jgi:hypothetical protein
MNYKCRDAIRARVELYNVAENTIAIDDDDEQCAADRSALLTACDKMAEALMDAYDYIHTCNDFALLDRIDAILSESASPQLPHQDPPSPKPE